MASAFSPSLGDPQQATTERTLNDEDEAVAEQGLIAPYKRAVGTGMERIHGDDQSPANQVIA
jgi:hypothetical protein